MKLLHRMLNIPVTRIGLLVLLDIVFVTISYILAFWLRIDVIDRSGSGRIYDTGYLFATLPWILIVRVAGYSAFFNVLSRQTQDDIIERTEQVLS